MSLQEYFNYNINFNTSNSLTLGQTTIGSIFTPGSGMLTHTVNTIGNMFMTGGNIGIGITDPTATLDISGNLSIQKLGLNTVGPTLRLLRAGANYGGAIWTSFYSSMTQEIMAFALANNSEPTLTSNIKMTLTGSGRLGIGTSNPAFNLDVNGTTRVVSGLTSAFNSNTLGPLITTGGNIGVGTVAPSYTLDVSGSGRFSNNLLATFNSNTIGSIITTGGNAGISTVPGAPLDIKGTSNWGIVRISPTSIGGESSLTFFPNNFDSQTGSTNSNWVIGTNLFGGGTNNFNIYRNGIATVLTINSSGNTGIGTATPLGRLHLSSGTTVGNIIIDNLSGSNDGFSYIGFNGYNTSAGVETRINTNKLRWRVSHDQRTTNDYFMIDAHNGTSFPYNLTFQVGTQGNIKLNTAGEARYHLYNNAGVSEWLFGQKSSTSSDFTFSKLVNTTETDYLTITTGGNVGIGTTAFSSKLSVAGSETSPNGQNSAILIQNTAATSGNAWLLRAGAVGTTTPASGFSIADSVGYKMVITSSGNVGIGTTSPTSTLDVNGTIRGVGSNSINYSPAHVLQNTSSIASPAVLTLLTPNLPTSGSTNFFTGRSLSNNNACDIQYVYVSTGSTQNAMQLGFYGQSTYNLTLIANGNVGIGTTSPAYTLDVNGTFEANNVNGTLLFASSGNVGIGTSTPTYKLDVNGSLRSTGDIFVGNGIGAEALHLWDIPGAAWQLATGDYKLNIRNGTVGSIMVDRVTISSTGNVGIGTITPIGKLSVDYSGISANQNVLSLHTSNTATNDYNLIEAGHGASTTFVLKGNGNVGIGTTTPSERLHINGNILLGPSTAADSNVDYTISTPGQLNINANNASTQDNTFVALSLTSGFSSNQSNIILCGSANNSFRHIAFATMNTERMRLSSAGNLGIGTASPAYPLDIINTVGSSNQPFMRIGNSTGGAGNQVGIILAPFTPRTGGASSQIISIDDGNASAHLTLWTAPSGTGTASVERVRIQNNGNVGIGTASPAFTLDVNGTIARSGVKLPRYDNGSFSGSASFSIPILFNDTQYNYAEFRVRYVTSAICNMNISATSYVNAAMNFGECALTTVKWDAQNVPVYATFSGVTSGIFADTVEMVGIDNNLIFRIVRATGTNTTGLRNHYSYDNVYCWSGVGTARGYGQGHIDNASVGGSPLQFVTFTCSTGTVSGTYSSVHYY